MPLPSKSERIMLAPSQTEAQGRRQSVRPPIKIRQNVKRCYLTTISSLSVWILNSSGASYLSLLRSPGDDGASQGK
ncbi:hypothetical protein BDN67DRAFT_967919 [Paxillus ammoniavirescens]|nr:hypothetical protein BDN67DRAFT_967919 [Paxillus ammoniavirescens]